MPLTQEQLSEQVRVLTNPAKMAGYIIDKMLSGYSLRLGHMAIGDGLSYLVSPDRDSWTQVPNEIVSDMLSNRILKVKKEKGVYVGELNSRKL